MTDDPKKYTAEDVKANLKRYLNMKDAAQRLMDRHLGRSLTRVGTTPSHGRRELPEWYMEYLNWTSLCTPPVVTERQAKVIDWNLRRRTPEEMERDIGYVPPSDRGTLTQAEIAQVLCVSVDTVSRDFREALDSVKRRMNASQRAGK